MQSNLEAILKMYLFCLYQGYKNAHGLLESEKSHLLGLSVGSNENDSEIELTQSPPVTRMQTFLSNINDYCCHLLGSSCHTIGRDFYQLPGLADALVKSVFSNLKATPDYRVRPIIRVFLKPFIYSCPPVFYETVLVPVLAHICTISKYLI